MTYFFHPDVPPGKSFATRMLGIFPPPLAEFILFGMKMAWACLFGALMLGLLLSTHMLWPDGAALLRYDFLFIAAVALQIFMLAAKLESLEEAKVILLYHLIGTVMEVFKTHMGSWAYPEEAVIKIGAVPLFTGFMYACVGSFIVRCVRLFDMRFDHYPPLWATFVLAVALYVNFFTHHYIWDARYLLFAAMAGMFWRTMIVYRVDREPRRMPFVLANILSAFFLWVAENIGTVTHTWLYPHQKTWEMVSLHKMGSWAMLLVISFVTVSLVVRPKPSDA